jgi:murein L,D-transpeptidase YafK
LWSPGKLAFCSCVLLSIGGILTLVSRATHVIVVILLASGPALAGPLPRGEKIDRLRIFKKRHRMEVYSGKKRIKVYRVVIGRGGAGPKRFEGDGRTPEGRYVIDSRHRSKKFLLFLHVSYPNARDRAAFRAAKRAGKLPGEARIGGAIGIHGEKKGWWHWLPHKWFDWTRGCIAVDNEEIKELYPAVKKNAVVEILP